VSAQDITTVALQPREGFHPPPPPAFCSGFYYTVRSGDSLFLIGHRYGCTVLQMMGSNPQITDPNVIYVGQVICIPRCAVALPPTSPGPHPGTIEIVIRIPIPCPPAS